MRIRRRAQQDKRYFRRTAHQAKAINLNPKIYRGGLRF